MLNCSALKGECRKKKEMKRDETVLSCHAIVLTYFVSKKNVKKHFNLDCLNSKSLGLDQLLKVGTVY